MEEGDLFSSTSREDAGLLPPTAFIFQALPDDTETLPEHTFDQQPPLYAVTHGQVGDIVRDKEIGSNYLSGGGLKPLVMLSHFDHPVNRAIVGTHAFNTVAQGIFQGIPISPDLTDPKNAVLSGAQHINNARDITDALGAMDDSGAIAEWIESSTESWKQIFRGNHAEQISPPDQSPIGEAFKREPLIEGVLQGMLAAKAVHEWVLLEEGGTPDQTAFLVHKIINERILSQ
ncbi:MAG TPA: hypothetical protein VK674_01575 [Candidatus Limnocylindria bacterium]|nr:hypothetical protein [Candidatus Limnocylindria bacterium]